MNCSFNKIGLLTITILFQVLVHLSAFSFNCGVSINSGYPIISSPTCGKDNGRIDVKATGSGTIMYRINGGAYKPNGSFSKLSEGIYTIDMKDESNCINTIEIPLSAETPLQVEKIEVQNVSCDGTRLGRITISATGLGLQYSIDGTNFKNTGDFIDLNSGKYTITIKDKNNCREVYSRTVYQGSIIISSINVKPSGCNNTSGEVKVNASGLNAIEYKLEGFSSNWQSANVFRNIPPGSYVAKVRDSKTTCEVIKNVTIAARINVDFKIKNSVCNKKNGQITINVKDSGVFEYSINNGTFGPQNSFSNLDKGRYLIRVRNSSGCSWSKYITINENSLINVQSKKVINTECSSDTGSIEVIATSSEILSFQLKSKDDSINQSNNTGQFNQLPTGNYSVRIQNQSGCTRNVSATIGFNNDIDANISARAAASSCTNATGSLTITASASSGISGYSINGTDFQTSNIFSNILSGDYNITVRSNGGCVRVVRASVPEINDISVQSVSIIPPTTRCSGDGKIVIKASGQNVEYSIDNVVFNTTGIFDGLNAGTYIIYIRSASGCTKQTGELILGSALKILSIKQNRSTCNQANGRLVVMANGDSLTYSIDGTNFQSSNVFNQLSSGTYTITVKDKNGCEIYADFNLENIGEAKVEQTQIVPTSCGEDNGELRISGSTASQFIEFSIDGRNYQADSTFYLLSAGQHFAYVRDSVGCVDSMVVYIPASTRPMLDFATKAPICQSENGEITVNHTGGVGHLEYSLDGLNFQTSNVFKNLSEGTYNLTVRDEVGCEVSDSISITRQCEPLLPNAIATNGNGMNESMRLIYFEPLNIVSYHIYNRWGQLVYKAENFISTDNHLWWTGQNQMSGSYLCAIEYEFKGQIIKKSTLFSLIH